MPPSSWIAWRYFRSQKHERFLSLLTTTAVSGVALGMAMLVVVLSVMRGFNAELTDRLLGFNAHIVVTATRADAPALLRGEVVEALKGASLREVFPFVDGEVIAQSDRTSHDPPTLGVHLRGIDDSGLKAMSTLHLYPPGGIEKLESDHGVILGYEAAETLLVHPDFNDAIDMTAPLAELGPTGELAPRSRHYQVKGIFRAGVYEYDSKYVLVSLAEARKLLGQQGHEGWRVLLESPEQVSRIVQRAREVLPEGWTATGWDEQNRKLFAALKLERYAMGAILLMVLLIASFSIVGVILLMTAGRRREIALLTSLGMTTSHIQRIFLLQGFWIGVLGSAIGIVVGWLLCLVIQRWPPHLPSSYYLDHLPVQVKPLALLLFGCAGIAMAMLVAAYPIRRTTSENPCEVLRYE